MKEQYMHDEAPVFHGRYVTYLGRTMLRAGGGEIDQGTETPAVDAAPDEGTPAIEPGEQDETFKSRYENLRPQYTQATQRLSETESLIERARSGDRDAFNQLLDGRFTLPEEEPDPEDELGELPADPRVAAHDEWIQQQQAQETRRLFNAHLDRLAGDTLKLSDWDRQAILAESMANGFTEQATETIVDRIKEERKSYDKGVIDAYIQSKNTTHVTPGGTGATEAPNLETHRDRVAYMTERLAQAQQQ